MLAKKRVRPRPAAEVCTSAQPVIIWLLILFGVALKVASFELLEEMLLEQCELTVRAAVMECAEVSSLQLHMFGLC